MSTKSLVVASKDGDQSTYLFRSYDHIEGDVKEIKNPGAADEHEIWEVARATSAAPTYFDPIIIDGEEYFDGGIGYNNPVALVFDEVMSKSGPPGACTMIEIFDLLVSIGTGQKPSKKLKMKRKLPLIKRLVSRLHLARVVGMLKIQATEVDKDHNTLTRLAKETKFNGYFRWTGGEAVGGLQLDEWLRESKGKKPPTKQFIEAEINLYMQDPEVKRELTFAAQKLVDRRRARCQEPNRHKYKHFHGRYGRYTLCNLLHCSWCPHDLTWKETEEDLVQHGVNFHGLKEAKAREAVTEQFHVAPVQFGGPH